MIRCLGIRGATTADANTSAAILDATEELMKQLVAANGLVEDDVAAVFFTVTTDLTADFPATAARIRLGWEQTAFMTAHEVPVPGSTPSVIRVLALVNTNKTKEELVHSYLRGASNLRSWGKAQA